MKENIEEVIEFLQGFNDGYTFQQCQTCFKFNEKDGCCNKEKCEELEAIEFLISDYKRIQEEFKQVDHECERLEQKELRLEKENEELKDRWDKDTHKLQNDLDIANAERIDWERAYQEEKDKQFELLRENQKIKDKIEKLKEKPLKINANNKYYYETDAYNKIIIQVLQDLLESKG